MDKVYYEKLIEEVFPIPVYCNDMYQYKHLSISEKIYYGIYQKTKGDFAKVDYIMSEELSKTRLFKIKKHLIELGLIIPEKIFTEEQAKKFTIEHSHKGLKCEWCGQECYVLHKHHYPISKCKNGNKVVNICPNCHCTYHKILREECL